MNNPTNDDNESESPDSLAHPVRRMIQRVRAATLKESTLDIAQETPPDASHPPLWLEVDEARLEGLFNLSGFDGPFSGALPASIGRFQIQRILGRGGFGLVFLARDPQLDRLVALKIPKFEALFSGQGKARFIREARAAALLGHPNIVSVYEAGQAGPVLYIAFEYVAGETLSHWISSNRQPAHPVPNQAIASLLQALSAAVHHANSRGIIHRDLKPANVLLQQDSVDVTRDSAELARRAKIADFGLAQLKSSDSFATQSGALLGTPIYAAPEQLKASAEEAKPTVDVYGLGAILYELLTGQPPFTGSSLAAIARAVETDLPVLPRRICPSVATDLEAICLKCLEKSPARRYATAADLQDDLERYLSGRPVVARHWTKPERIKRWLAQNCLVASMAALIFLALSIAMGLAFWQADRYHELFETSESHRRTALKNFELIQIQKTRAENHLQRAESAIDQMLNKVALELERVPGLTKLRTSLLEKALEFEHQLMVAEGDDPDVLLRAAKAQGRVGHIQLLLGQTQESLDSLNLALQMAQNVNPETSEQEANRRHILRVTKNYLARVFSQLGRFSEIEEMMAPLVAEFTDTDLTTAEPEDLRILRASASLLARAQMRQNRFAQAEATYQLGISADEAIAEEFRTVEDRQSHAKALGSLANIYAASGNFQRAAEYYQQAITAIEALLTLEPDDPQILTTQGMTYSNLTSCFIEMGDFPAALECAEKGKQIADGLMQEFPEVSAHQEMMKSLLMSLAISTERIGQDLPLARQCYQEAIAFLETTAQHVDPTPNSLQNMALTYGQYGNFLHKKMGASEEARSMLVRQVELAREFFEKYPQMSTRHWILSFALGNQADYYLDLDDCESAEPVFREAENEAVQMLAATPSSKKYVDNLIWQRDKLSQTLVRLGRCQEAVDVANSIGNIGEPSKELSFASAKTLAQCIDIARNNADLPPETVAMIKTAFLEAIAKAIDLGWAEREVLVHLGQTTGLSSEPEFIQQLNRI